MQQAESKSNTRMVNQLRRVVDVHQVLVLFLIQIYSFHIFWQIFLFVTRKQTESRLLILERARVLLKVKFKEWYIFFPPVFEIMCTGMCILYIYI